VQLGVEAAGAGTFLAGTVVEDRCYRRTIAAPAEAQPESLRLKGL
jgi:hypothetical protein